MLIFFQFMEQAHMPGFSALLHKLQKADLLQDGMNGDIADAVFGFGAFLVIAATFRIILHVDQDDRHAVYVPNIFQVKLAYLVHSHTRP